MLPSPWRSSRWEARRVDGHVRHLQFFPSKNLGGFGDAGLLATSDDALAEKARLLRTHGAKPKYFHKMVGGNFRMDPLQAAMLGVKLDHLEEYSRNRQCNAAYYDERLSALAGVARQDPGSCVCQTGGAEPDWARDGVRILLPATRPGNKHIWNQYTIRVLTNGSNDMGTQRDKLRDHLTARGIGSEIYYSRPMHLQECFARPGFTQPALPVAERLAGECLSIPIYPELTTAQQHTVVEAIADFLLGSM